MATTSMLCGANDLKDFILDAFIEICADFQIETLNYLDGTIYYSNYGNDPWTKNSIYSVNNADIIVFVIQEKFGHITWNVEFEEAYSQGKNFIFLCNQNTYDLFLNSKTYGFKVDKKNKDLINIIDSLKRIETVFQITIIPFKQINFKQILKNQFSKLFLDSLKHLEKENRKNSFLPILLSTKFNDKPQEYISEKNTKIVYDILFDFYEKKEIRKKAMEYFFTNKVLTDEDIIRLCLDSEQGVSRKSVENILFLINNNSNKELIFDNVITSISNEEVGIIRRAINTFFDLDLELSIKYFDLFFPTSDVGTPKRIISKIYENKAIVIEKCNSNAELKNNLKNLIFKSLNYTLDKGSWKDNGNELLDLIK